MSENKIDKLKIGIYSLNVFKYFTKKKLYKIFVKNKNGIKFSRKEKKSIRRYHSDLNKIAVDKFGFKVNSYQITMNIFNEYCVINA